LDLDTSSLSGSTSFSKLNSFYSNFQSSLFLYLDGNVVIVEVEAVEEELEPEVVTEIETAEEDIAVQVEEQATLEVAVEAVQLAEAGGSTEAAGIKVQFD
jgi:hypothetical protein